MLLSHLLEGSLGVGKVTYLDIGAHHASYLSNTYHFYRRNFSGVLVEPDPQLFEAIKAARPRDVCLNVGIGTGTAEGAEFYVMRDRTLSTFSRPEVDAYLRKGYPEPETIMVPLVTVNEILRKHFSAPPSFVSIDTEGMDLPILKSIDLTRNRPLAFCVETSTHEDQKKITEIPEFFARNGYVVHSDTYLNTIFVEQDAWAKRRT
jgi:FkbM family methyltransferase